MADEVQVPHLAFPVRLSSTGAFAVVEQDSPDEVTQCVAVLVGTVVDQRQELPAYGILDPTFTDGTDIAEVLDAVATWEPRASAAITSEVDSIDELLENVYVNVATA
jgi:hypothetical protein